MHHSKLITKKRFNDWLEKQPEDRTWKYSAITACLFASFIRETTPFINASCGGIYWRETRYNHNENQRHTLKFWMVKTQSKIIRAEEYNGLITKQIAIKALSK